MHGAEDAHGAGFLLIVEGARAQAACPQIAARYQRLFPRRNLHSTGPRFDRLLAAHAALHDRAKPLVRADHDHALDVWQWTLELVPDASEALQIAALFHDVERLASEADRRVEQHAADYLAFKQQHAARGAEMLDAQLGALGYEEALRARASALVARHEQPGDDLELAWLNDADALSFFGLNSAGYLAYFGPAQTRSKVAYTLRRLRSARARAALRGLRLEPAIASMIQLESGALGQPT